MRLERYFEISQSEDIPTFTSRLIRFANDMDFGLVSTQLVVDPIQPNAVPQIASTSNSSEAWQSSFKDPLTAQRDPVMRRLRTLSVPFIYTQETYTSEGAGELYEAQAPHGYKTGIAVAIHLPDKRHFMLGVDRTEPLPKKQERVIRMMADLQLLAVHAQSAAIRLLDPSQQCGNTRPHLTPKECEVLKWTMAGKSAYAVGRLMAISPNTVNFHFRGIFRKLNASSKHQAVLQALALGLI